MGQERIILDEEVQKKKNKTFSPFCEYWIWVFRCICFIWSTYKGQEISEGSWESVCQWMGDWTNEGLKGENRTGGVKLAWAMEGWDKAIDAGKDK